MSRLIDADALLYDIHNAMCADCKDECAACQWRDAIKLIENAPTVATDNNVLGKWISVKDGLPDEHDSIFAKHPHLSKHMWAKESDDVIVYVVFPDGSGRSTEGRLHDGKWNTKISPMLEPVITHWMPLPEPPEEDNNG